MALICHLWLISLACIQTSKDSEPIRLESACSISWSLVAHPGDGELIVHELIYLIQRVHAIGKPPEGPRNALSFRPHEECCCTSIGW